MIEQANTAGISIITVDRTLSSGKIATSISSDNVKGGQMAGDFIVTAIGTKGKILVLEGFVGSTTANDRQKGFDSVMSKYSGITQTKEIADFDRQKAKAVAARVLADNSYQAVFAQNDNMILGVMDVLDELKLQKNPILVGFDGIPEAREAVINGKVSATIAQQPDKIGYLAVQSAIQILNGISAPKSTQFVDVQLIKK